jgi:hypothetical protein
MPSPSSQYSTTTRYLHHRPRPQDAEALGRAFAARGEFGGEVAPKPLEERDPRGS